MHSRGFWSTLPRPFFALAPMADVTDAAFRRFVARHSRHGEAGGGPDVFWTEFVSADGLARAPRDTSLADLAFSDNEHPIVAQIYSADPATITPAAERIRELGFDGIDLNMGCPHNKVERKGTGAAHMQDYRRAQEVIRAAHEGGGGLPVSVKTRLGYARVEELETWVAALADTDLAALTVHARTRVEMSRVPARWECVGRVVDLLRKRGSTTLVIGNGDVRTLADAEEKARATGADGVMIGRGAFGNPWLFDRTLDPGSVTPSDRLRALIEHAALFEEYARGRKSFDVMKRQFKAYVKGFEGAKEFRIRLMEAPTAAAVERLVTAYLVAAPPRYTGRASAGG